MKFEISNDVRAFSTEVGVKVFKRYVTDIEAASYVTSLALSRAKGRKEKERLARMHNAYARKPAMAETTLREIRERMKR